MIDRGAGSGAGRQPIGETVRVEVLSASINGQGTVSVTFRVTGGFERPGSRATLDATVIVVTVPARVVAR